MKASPMSQNPNHDHATNTARLPTPENRNRPLFPLGHLVATAGVNAHLIDNGIDPTPFIRQHHCGLWGDVPPEDAQENDFSVLNGFRVLSSYLIAGERVWIITEADRSSTTLLLPREY
jgi:hypothetical protein